MVIGINTNIPQPMKMMMNNCVTLGVYAVIGFLPKTRYNHCNGNIAREGVFCAVVLYSVLR